MEPISLQKSSISPDIVDKIWIRRRQGSSILIIPSILTRSVFCALIPFDATMKDSVKRKWSKKQEGMTKDFFVHCMNQKALPRGKWSRIRVSLPRWKAGMPLPSESSFLFEHSCNNTRSCRICKTWAKSKEKKSFENFDLLGLRFPLENFSGIEQICTLSTQIEQRYPGTLADATKTYLAFRTRFFRRCHELWEQGAIAALPLRAQELGLRLSGLSYPMEDEDFDDPDDFNDPDDFDDIDDPDDFTWQNDLRKPYSIFRPHAETITGPWHRWVTQKTDVYGRSAASFDAWDWQFLETGSRLPKSMPCPAMTFSECVAWTHQLSEMVHADDDLCTFKENLNLLSALKEPLMAYNALKHYYNSRFVDLIPFLKFHFFEFIMGQDLDPVVERFKGVQGVTKLLNLFDDPTMAPCFFEIGRDQSVAPSPEYSFKIREDKDHKGYLLISPALRRPEFTGLTQSALKRLEKDGIDRTFISLNELMEQTQLEGRTDAWLGGGVWFQGMRCHMIGSLLTFALQFPEHFANVDLIHRGECQLRREDWEDLVALHPHLGADSKESPFLMERPIPVFENFFHTHPFETIPGRVGVSRGSKRALVIESPLESSFEPEQTFTALPFGESVRVSSGIRYQLKNGDDVVPKLHDLIDLAKAAQDGSQPFKKMLEELEFEPKPYFEVDGVEISPEDWVAGKLTKLNVYMLPSGLSIPKEQYETTLKSFILRQKAFARVHTVRFRDLWRTHLSSLSTTKSPGFNLETYLSQLALKVDDAFVAMQSEMLKYFHSEVAENETPLIQSSLRPYQSEGLAWVLTTTAMGLGACLADEMGLGKTVQALAYLSMIYEKGKQVLLMVPKSLLINWQREISQFTSHFTSHRWSGGAIPEDQDIIITTWDLVRRYIDEFSQKQWHCVVIDEAHGFKNPDSKRSQAIQKLQSTHRLALTGTPVENKASELWSIVDWLNPGYLGPKTSFSQYTKLARSNEEKNLMLAPIRNVLASVILRRTKDDPKVQIDLPDKVIEEHYYELSEEQNVLYRGILEAVYTSFDLKELNHLSVLARQSIYLKALTCIKQLCNHPENFLKVSENPSSDEPFESEFLVKKFDLSKKLESKLKKLIARYDKKILKGTSSQLRWQRSGKFAAFRDLIGECEAERGGILIFTQYRATAQLLQECLLDFGVDAWENVPFLHGGLSENQRMSMVDDFQKACAEQAKNPAVGCPILLLSLKAGGVGLNLTGATRVIHFDRWWNPAVEDQATDRAHRIGQKQTVFVHHLIGDKTLEASISKMLFEKRSLANDLLGQAAGVNPSDFLGTQEGFLNLVDPEGVFRK